MSNLTAAEYLCPFRDAIPPGLITPQNLAAMERIAALLPGSLTSFFGFECRLGDTDTASDILFAINAQEMQTLAQRGDRLLPAEMLELAAWQRARALSRAVTMPGSILAGKVDNLWLEYDVATLPHTGFPTPSVFFGSQRLNSIADAAWFTDEVLPTLYGEYLAPEVQARVIACLGALPPPGMVFQTGAMLSRQPPFVRLCLTNFPSTAFAAYLQEIGWEGDPDRLEEVLEPLARLVDFITLDIDVSATVGPTIGLECYFEPRRAPQFEPRWFPFLDFLQERGWLTAAKRAALVAFSGFVHEKSPDVSYPPALLNASKFLGRNFYSSILRGPHHVKIVLNGEQVQAKGYFYIEHYWLKPSDLSKSALELSTPRTRL